MPRVGNMNANRQAGVDPLLLAGSTAAAGVLLATAHQVGFLNLGCVGHLWLLLLVVLG